MLTKQIARKSVGGKAPRRQLVEQKQLVSQATRKKPPAATGQ